MPIFWIIAIVIVGLMIVSFILSCVNFSQIQELQREIQRLKFPKNPETEIKMPENNIHPIADKVTLPETEAKKSKINFEQQFGARLPVWIGGIAMALAGFFLVKYSIEAGLLTEKVRVLTGILFGLVLLTAGNWVRRKPAFANGIRIAQALTGAGIAELYACAFSATSLYHLVPIWMGFVAMALITGVAIILSLRHGPPIALMGLLGGLVTPLLINSGAHNTAFLFTYLYLVIVGLLVLIRQKNWWWLFFPAVIGVFSWVIFWMFFTDFVSDDGLYLSLFLVALSVSFIFVSIQNLNTENKSLSFKRLNILTLCGAIFLMAIVGFKTKFDFQTWSLFGLLAAGSIVLAYFKQKIYGFLPWVLMIVNAIMLFTWRDAAPNIIASVIIIFALIYSTSACCVLWRSQKPLQWAGLAGVCSVVYYLIAYHQLHDQYTSIALWGGIAIGLFLLAIIMINQLLGKFNSDKDLKQKLLSIFVLTATTFLSLSLAIIFKQKLLPIAFAAQIFVISWINTKVDIKILRKISVLLICIFIYLLLPQISFFIDLLIRSLQASLINPVLSSTDFSIIHSPILQLGLPAILFGGASIFFRKQIDDNLVRFLEISSIILLGLMGYCLFRYLYHSYASFILERASFTERGIITNIILAYSLICIWLGGRFLRTAIVSIGLVLLGVALSRIIYFDLFMYNPMLSKEFVGGTPIFNALILAYGLPLIGILSLNKINIYLDIRKYFNIINIFGLVLLFVFITFNIRQFYQGEYLNGPSASNAEIYSYSIAWLLMGIGLLLAGTLKHHKFIRIASLVVMMLTVGKVFLYDASALTGLYRVFSFFGLGLCLIVLSWFYTRFVFKQQ